MKGAKMKKYKIGDMIVLQGIGWKMVVKFVELQTKGSRNKCFVVYDDEKDTLDWSGRIIWVSNSQINMHSKGKIDEKELVLIALE